MGSTRSPFNSKDLAEFFYKEIQIFNRSIAVITSGGTYVPLEKNMVRFIENVSTGTRGAHSAEHFLKSGFSVLFFHRKGSHLPFTVDCPSKHDLIMEIVKSIASSKEREYNDKLYSEIFIESSKNLVKYADKLFLMEFGSITEYFDGIKEITLLTGKFSKNVIFFLAAAVSDFYIPEKLLSHNKISINSCENLDLDSEDLTPCLKLDLYSSPKSVHYIRDSSPNSFLVLFKLETEVEVLLDKSMNLLSKYNADVICANLLHDRRDKVTILTRDSRIELKKVDDDPIEKSIVANIISIYRQFFNNKVGIK
ncbi:phosphopantothenate--cysteine ligase [Cryptosporidium felis]|nr:phosphopantothenate--cysteine ligase [Cryptosporidium felis]